MAKNGMGEMLGSVAAYLSPFSAGTKEKRMAGRIVRATGAVDRKFFVPRGYPAYEDAAMPIGEGQTVSQPSTVARMLMLAELGRGQSVLEVGSGSGWSACLAAFLVHPGSVTSLERIGALSERARANLNAFAGSLGRRQAERFSRIVFIHGNLFDHSGARRSGYDRIIITAGISPGREGTLDRVASGLLKDRGILVCPHELGPMIVKKRSGAKIRTSYTTENYAFVPLVAD